MQERRRRLAVRPNPDEWEAELQELADATERVAQMIADPALASRLRAMAQEVRAMVQRGSHPSGACCLPV
jgi:predicted transcriptional regulator